MPQADGSPDVTPVIVAYDKSDPVQFAKERAARDNALKAAGNVGGVTGMAAERRARRAAERWKQSRNESAKVPTFDVSKFVSHLLSCYDNMHNIFKLLRLAKRYDSLD